MSAFKNIKGQRFGKLLVKSFDGRENNVTKWNCVCKCGNEIVVRGSDLRSGNTKSCGCLKKEVTAERRTTHGASTTPEYSTWHDIKNRCINPKDKRFKDYGGRGITVCERWLNSFENFIADVGLKPSKEHSIDRINNSGNYCKENCKWSTREEQGRNKRNNFFLTFNGKTLTITDWEKELGINKNTIYKRLKKGWTIEKSLQTIVKKYESSNIHMAT